MKAEYSIKFRLKVMFEKRPIWALIVGLNVCVLIWLISVQEPVTFDVNTAALSSSSSGSSSNFLSNVNTVTGQETGSPVAAALQQQQQQHDSISWGRDLLSNHLSAQSNEYDDNLTAANSNSTTFNFNNNHNNSNNIKNATKASKQTAFLHNFENIKTTTKTSDLSSNIQKLTSSLGTGVLDVKTQPTPSWVKLNAVASALPAEDFNQLIDLKDFRFLLPQPVCGNHIEALILVHSAPKNHEKRQVIRETWASVGHHTAESALRVLFLLGAVDNELVQNDLQNENDINGDIVQGSFIDDYRNMTYKHVMAFKWFLYNCPQAQILIKVDDDVYVNTPQLIKYLKDQQQRSQLNARNDTKLDNPTTTTRVTTMATTATPNTANNTATNFLSLFHNFNVFATVPPHITNLTSFTAAQQLFNHPKDLLFCQEIIGSLVKRSYRSKWRVSFKEYSERYYPPYCPGYAIIYSPDIVQRLYVAAQNTKYFWIDDVHITGVLAQRTNTTITNSSRYVLFSDECDQILMGKTDLSKTEFLFAWHSISAEKIKFLWHLQMMTLQTPDQLHYKKNTINDDDKVQRKRQHQLRTNQQRQTKMDGEYTSSYTYTSANGYR